MATTFHYRCPSTGQTVQGWSADDVSDDGDEYQSVACLACAQVHLVNLKTGKVLGVAELCGAAFCLSPSARLPPSNAHHARTDHL